jgi:hypothetical protein
MRIVYLVISPNTMATHIKQFTILFLRYFISAHHHHDPYYPEPYHGAHPQDHHGRYHNDPYYPHGQMEPYNNPRGQMEPYSMDQHVGPTSMAYYHSEKREVASGVPTNVIVMPNRKNILI